MSFIGEAVLTASVELLLNRLVNELLRFPGQEKVRAELKQWEIKLKNINSVLADAEEKQITKSPVKDWLVDLQILSYDVEDILDEFATKLSLESEATTSKARRVVLNFNPQSVKFNKKMLSKIEDITGRLEKITNQINFLQLIANSAEKPPNRVSQGRIPTTSLNDPQFYGRKKDQDAIIELLLKDDDEGSEDGISVIPIVGIGGVGKTTLAQNVYNDVRVESRFDLKAWACVSDDFDLKVITTQAILQFIAPETLDTSNFDLNMLQVELKNKLLGKQFLIVLDDIWCENRNKLESLLRPFKFNSPGGKIIVTTRSENISSMVRTSPAYPLKELSDDDCLSIFAYHSRFGGHPQYLQKIGENIVKKCQGLPLAAKTLGGLLCNNTDRNDWEGVSSSDIWNLPMQEGDIMPALRLSYHYLPPHLKPCFACCSLLPKDHEFEKEEIILLWMAQGFLQQKGCTEEQMEDVGDNYFRELQSRSFFQHSSDGSSRYVMHDLINDLARWVAGEFFFRMENIVEDDNLKNISKNLRHLSYIPDDRFDGIRKFVAFYGVESLSNLTYNGGLYDGVKMFDAFNDLRHLRTFLPLMRPRRYGDYCYLTSDILNILPKLRRLRILSLKGYNITELSDAIGDLKQLKYFDLSRTTIEVLPKSVGRLYNLQTLKLKCCCRLRKLCEEMENLIKLRYLDFSGSGYLEGMPLKIGKLTSLRTLSDFVVGKSTNCRLKELKWLKHLRGTLRISGLENINDAMDAKEADLSGKKNLTELVLAWSPWESGNERIEMEVLDMLQPCNEKLEKLTINGYGGMMFPTWLGNTSLSNLVFLRFDNCSTCTSLPSVGKLPSLKELYIDGMSGIKKVGQEFYGNGCSTPFPKLEILYLEVMNQWEEWEEWISHEDQEDSGLPQLRELVISECVKLIGRLPKRLPSLKKLRISRCQQLQVSVLPADCDIEINGCLSSLNPLIFCNVPSHVFKIKQFTQRLSKVQAVKIVGITSQEVVKDDFACLAKLPQALRNFSFLTRISVAKFPGLVFFSEVDLPPQLKTIDIESCNSLKSLPESWMKNTSLERLSINRCGSLAYLARSQLPPNLKHLEVGCCDKLQTLMQEENNNLPSSTSSLIKSELPATLEYISIRYCSNLSSLSSSGNLPTALKRLSLCVLEKIEAVAKTIHNTCLEEIEISYCPSLVSFPVGEMPSMNLVTIRIEKCEKLEAFTDNVHQLSGLQVTGSDCSTQRSASANFTQLTITIRDCSNLVAFPDRGLPFTNLTGLIIENCKKLEALPNCMHNLTSLRELWIENCPGIKSFPPEDGFPTSLMLLDIRKLNIFKPLSEWGLHRRTSLEHLRIEGCSDVVSFPMEEMLPASLTTLKIKDFPNLKYLSPTIQNLNFLKGLRLSNCPKLKSFPKKGLPFSLLELLIYGCPLLKQKCRKNRGKYWSLIAHIPLFKIKDEEEYDLIDLVICTIDASKTPKQGSGCGSWVVLNQE